MSGTDLSVLTGDVAQLVLSSSEGVRRVNTAGMEYREMAAHLLGPGPMAALTANRTVYWARPGQGSIYRYTSQRVKHFLNLALVNINMNVDHSSFAL